jgi:hypothetical protein
MPRPVRIKAVKHVHSFTVQLDFTDGTKKEIDLLPYLRGPIFEALRNDPRVFQTVKVDERMGTIVWANGADIDPDVLYKRIDTGLDGRAESYYNSVVGEFVIRAKQNCDNDRQH